MKRVPEVLVRLWWSVSFRTYFFCARYMEILSSNLIIMTVEFYSETYGYCVNYLTDL